MNSVTAIVFSKNRAMQLDLCLKTFRKQCQDIERIDISILYKTTTQKHKNSYDILKDNYPKINFIKENNFKEDLLNIIDGNTHVLFIVDDTIFIDRFYIGDMVDALEYTHNEYVLGVSLRLGKNTTRCYPFNKTQKIPNFMNGWFGFQKFDWQKGQYDFGYPLELSSSMYRLSDLRFILKSAYYNNPNELEYLLSSNAVVIHKKYLLCYHTSVAFSNPVNRVQETNHNRFATEYKYTSEFLVDLFLDKFRVDATAFENFISNGCHHESEFLFVKNKEITNE